MRPLIDTPESVKTGAVLITGIVAVPLVVKLFTIILAFGLIPISILVESLDKVIGADATNPFTTRFYISRSPVPTAGIVISKASCLSFKK